MATYVNDLRLKEIATGDESGTWGTSTNTNLELIAEAFSFGTEGITTNADTHTTTIADGSTDPGRSIYLKYTGTLDSACTITIGPNTVSKLWFIENGTSGSQNIIISQGSGANVTIPPGDVKAVYSDGAGSGAAIVDAFASLNVVDLKVEDDLTVTDDASVGGDLLVSGEVQTANIGFTDGDNAITIADGGGITAAAGITSTAASNTFGATSFNDADITNVGSISLDTITNDGTNITLDSSGNITLNADDDGKVFVADDSVTYGLFENSSSNFVIESRVQDKDILFKGNDGGSGITALTLDFSEAGAATFNSNITAGSVSTGTSTATPIELNLGSTFANSAGSNAKTKLKVFEDSSANVYGFGVSSGVLEYHVPSTAIHAFYVNDSEKFRVATDGNIGIGTTDTGNAKLVFNGAISEGADTAMIDFDGFGTRGANSSQSINFRMGRTGFATDQPAQIKSFFTGGGATAAATNIGFKFTTIVANSQHDALFIDASHSRFKFNTSESPQSNNPQTNNCFVIGPSTSTAVTQSLTNACVLINRGGELFAVDSSHNNTQITPHNWKLIEEGPSEELAWTYWSERPNPSNPDELQGINVDMAKVVRKVEDLVGEKLIYTENSDMDSHTHQTIISDIQATLADLKTRVENLEG